jgi:hypothetical protein
MHGRQEPDLRIGRKHSHRVPADRPRLDQLIISPAGLDLQNCTPVDRLSAQDIGKDANCQYRKILFWHEHSASSKFSCRALSVWQKGSQFILVVVIPMVRRAVVSLIDRTNVETLIVAGKVRKWKGQLLDIDLPNLHR